MKYFKLGMLAIALSVSTYSFSIFSYSPPVKAAACSGFRHYIACSTGCSPTPNNCAGQPGGMGVYCTLGTLAIYNNGQKVVSTGGSGTFCVAPTPCTSTCS